MKNVGKSKNDETTRTGNRSRVKKEKRKSLQRSRSDATLGLPKPKKKNSKSRSSTSQYDLMSSLHSTDEDYEYCDVNSVSDDEDLFSDENVDDVNDDRNVAEASKSVPPPSPSLKDFDSDEESWDEVVKLKQNKSLGEHVTAQKVEECDDILSMAEFSNNIQVANELNESSCLQIDFSRFSEHGTPAVKAKKVVKRGSRSKRENRTVILAPTVKAP